MSQTTALGPSMRARQGTILIVTLWIIFVLAGMVIVFARAMRVEAIASANQIASMQAAAIERGAEQYVLALVETQQDSVLTLTEDAFMAVPVGDGYFWIIRPNYADSQLPCYGLIDEASKLNLNTASLDMLSALPAMDVYVDLPPAIIDWRDGDDEISAGGAEVEYYMALPNPYACKNAPLESVEELLLVRDGTGELLYGLNASGLPNNAPTWSLDVSLQLGAEYHTVHGIFDYVTVYSAEPNTGGSTGTGGSSGGPGSSSGGSGGSSGGSGGSSGAPGSSPGGSTGGSQQSGMGLINVNTAPQEVLLCLPGLDETDVAAILSGRADANLDRTSTDWVAEAIPNKFSAIRNLITARSYQYTADIVAVSGTGRAFKRCRIVVDGRSSPPRIVYRRDLTEYGWPLDPEILASLRSGTFRSDAMPITVGGAL